MEITEGLYHVNRGGEESENSHASTNAERKKRPKTKIFVDFGAFFTNGLRCCCVNFKLL